MLSEFLDLEPLRKGDIVVHIYRPGFFRIEGEPEEVMDSWGRWYNRVMMRRVATKGLKMRRETRPYYSGTAEIVHLKRGLEALEERLNELNPLK